MKKGLASILGIVAVALVIVGLSSVFVVHQTEQALVLQFGEPQRVVKEPGLHFKVPFVQNVVSFDNRVLSFDADTQEVIAADQKRLVVDAFARFRITDPLLFYQAVGNEAVVRARLDAVVNASMRNVLGEVPLATVLTGQRAALMRTISDRVNSQVKDFGIEVLDVRMRRADLPEANSQAIYNRMRTEREREAREFRAVVPSRLSASALARIVSARSFWPRPASRRRSPEVRATLRRSRSLPMRSARTSSSSTSIGACRPTAMP